MYAQPAVFCIRLTADFLPPISRRSAVTDYISAAFPPRPNLSLLNRFVKYTLSCLPLFLLTACLPDGPDTGDRFAVKGVDVSHYQGIINWDNLARDGHDFAFIKASEGEKLKDDLFARNWEEAGRVGIRRGAYHFFRPEVSPVKQAANFFQQADLRPGDLPPVLDVEHRGKLSPEELITAVKTWAEMAEARYGVKPIIYSGQNFYNRFLAGQLNDYPLWLARYDATAPVTVCGRDFEFWQYTDAGQLPGVEGDIDRNVFYGSHLDLALLCIPPPAAPTGRHDLAKIGE